MMIFWWILIIVIILIAIRVIMRGRTNQSNNQDGSPLEILGVEIIEAEGAKGGFSIGHGIIIRSGLKPSQEGPTGSSGER